MRGETTKLHLPANTILFVQDVEYRKYYSFWGSNRIETQGMTYVGSVTIGVFVWHVFIDCPTVK